MNKRPSAQAGFSLVEALVSLVLLSIVAYFILASQNKAQKIMFKGTSRDAHAQIVSVIKNKSNKTLREILTAANTNPGGLASLLNTELNLGEGIRLTWAKPVNNKSPIVNMQFVSNPDPVAKEAIEACRHSKSYLKAWVGPELPIRLASQKLTVCGQLIMPPVPEKGFGAQNMAQAKYGFLALDVNFTKVIDGTSIPLSQFGPGGTIATVTWTLVWNYEKNNGNVQQFRKGIYHIMP